MKAVVQRVLQASVSINGVITASCERGFLILLGIGREDSDADIEKLWSKIFKLRIFPDGERHTGAALSDVAGEALIVSQFTLYADCRKGNRPSFTDAGDPAESERLYEAFIERARRHLPSVSLGEFGADMQVSLVNDGPFTIVLDTDDLSRSRRG